MTSKSALFADNLFGIDCQRPPVPGCGDILGNDFATASKSSELSYSFNTVADSPLSPSLAVTLPTSRTPYLPQPPDGCTTSMAICPEISDPRSSKMDSLLSLLNDRRGVTYFRQFVSTRNARDMLEFWLACVGYRKIDAAKCSSFALVIYKTFIAPTSSQLCLAATTRRVIRERLKSGNVDHTTFVSAVAEVETILLRDYYPLFLESDEYAEYIRVRSTNQSPSCDGSSGHSSNGSQSHTVDEDDSLRCNDDGPCKDKTQEHSMTCTGDCLTQTGALNRLPLDVTTSSAAVPAATSISEDALSCTDASLYSRDYRYVPSSYCPRCSSQVRAHKTSSSSRARCGANTDNIAQNDPGRFASLLTAKLSRLTTKKHEEQLDRDSGMESFQDAVSGSVHASLTSSSKMSAISSALLAAAASEEEESAESILERHMSLVFSGPNTKTSAVTCHSSAKSPAQHQGLRMASSGHHPVNYPADHVKSSSLTHSQSAAEGNWSDQWSSSERGLPAFRTSASFGDGDLSHCKLYQPCFSELARFDDDRAPVQVPHITAASKHHQQRHQSSCLHADSEKKVRRWINEQMELPSELSTAVPSTSSNLPSRCSASRKQPTQPIIQDPSMPLLSPPDPATQLEEARRRLQQHTVITAPPKSLLVAGRDHSAQSSRPLLPPDSSRSPVPRPSQDNKQTSHVTVIVYYMCDEPIPYSTRVHSATVTLLQFKDLIVKKGCFRYYFKRACDDFNSGFVYEELSDDDAELPMIDGKICAKVVRMLT